MVLLISFACGFNTWDPTLYSTDRTALSWGVVGTPFSLNVVGSSWAEVRPVSQDLLRFSRFPQGFPEGYGP